MQVLKFGGTSLGSSKNINKVISILENQTKNNKVVCVVSAIAGVTDALLKAGELAKNKDTQYIKAFQDIQKKHLLIVEELKPMHNKEIQSHLKDQLGDLKKFLDGIFLINELSPQTTDKLMSYGELLSSYIITEVIREKGIAVTRKNGQELIITNSNFTKAEVKFDSTNKQIHDYFRTAGQDLTIVPGFISKSERNEFTTLGRGGSDYTAAIIAAVLQVDTLEIWTDVSGMFTANPKLVKQAHPISFISYQEAMELSHFGAKVLYPPSVQPVLFSNIPIRIKNTFYR